MMRIETKIRILLTLTAAAAAAAGFAAGRTSASLRVCPARCPLNQKTRIPEESRKPGNSFSCVPEEQAPAEAIEELPEVRDVPGIFSSRTDSDSKSAPDPESPKYIGNRLSKIFHDPSCRYCANTSDKYRVELHSVENAISQGFKPCRRCLPENTAGPETENQV